jgi:hypothetical protein
MFALLAPTPSPIIFDATILLNAHDSAIIHHGRRTMKPVLARLQAATPGTFGLSRVLPLIKSFIDAAPQDATGAFDLSLAA